MPAGKHPKSHLQFASRSGRGLFFGLTAAILYGFIPAFTLPIRSSTAGGADGALPDLSILFYRFATAAVILGLIMLVRRRSFRITRGEGVTLLYLAFLSDGAAMFLLAGYSYLSSGVATTLHFLYPVVTAIIMMVFYHEARRKSTIAAVLMAVLGVGLLSWPSGDAAFPARGIVLEIVSAVCFALYIIRLNRSRVARMDNLKLMFYIMLFGAFIFGGEAYRQSQLHAVTTGTQVANLLGLGLVCTVVTNLALVKAVKSIGSTLTAVLGACEPLTAVIVGHILFREPATLNIVAGIVLIVTAVLLVIITRRR